jgi:glycerol-3-phosphate dehydrogenase
MPDAGSHSRARCFDVVIIGAGVVGCALARRFALCGADVVILEKASDILDGASKGNSAILHTGFDAPPGSMEQVCVAAGYAEYLEIHEALGLGPRSRRRPCPR